MKNLGPAPAMPRPSRLGEDSPDVGDPGAGVVVRLFDADRADSTIGLDAALRRRLGKRQLLWIDVDGDLGDAAADAIARRMGLSARTRRSLVEAADRPHVSLHGTYFHLRVATVADRRPGEGPRWIDLIAGERIVVTSHRVPIHLLRDLDERIESDTTLGAIDGGTFVRVVLDATITGYLRTVDEIEDAIDDLDGRALKRRAANEVLVGLGALRRRIARIRRALSEQREVYAALGSADFAAVTPGDDAADYRAVSERFAAALEAVETCRDLLIGSFDLLMTRTAQRTNEAMKVLALATILLLPGSLIAGLLGMNVEVPLPTDGIASFWIVVVAIGALAATVLTIARARHWI